MISSHEVDGHEILGGYCREVAYKAQISIGLWIKMGPERIISR